MQLHSYIHCTYLHLVKFFVYNYIGTVIVFNLCIIIYVIYFNFSFVHVFAAVCPCRECMCWSGDEKPSECAGVDEEASTHLVSLPTPRCHHYHWGGREETRCPGRGARGSQSTSLYREDGERTMHTCIHSRRQKKVYIYIVCTTKRLFPCRFWLISVQHPALFPFCAYDRLYYTPSPSHR